MSPDNQCQIAKILISLITLGAGDAVVDRGNAWMDSMKEWTSLPVPELLTKASRRKDWKRISAESTLMPPLTTQLVKGLN